MLYHKMPLNPAFSTSAASAAAPDAKLTFNINAFNGNKTNFGGGSAPKPKSMTAPVQPMRDASSLLPSTTPTKPRPGMIMPM
jgi:hypothetical protein